MSWLTIITWVLLAGTVVANCATLYCLRVADKARAETAATLRAHQRAIASNVDMLRAVVRMTGGAK